MKFKDSVKNVKITDKYIIIALEKKVFLYEFDTFKQLLSISTYVNPLG